MVVPIFNRKIYGDAALGEANMKMIEIARSYNSAVKFPGSGGAVIGLSLDKTNMVRHVIHVFVGNCHPECCPWIRKTAYLHSFILLSCNYIYRINVR